MSRTVVELLIKRIREIVHQKGEVKIGLPTGNTPLKIYEALRTQYKNDSIWEHVTLVRLDEYVGQEPNSPQSFQKQLREALVNHLKLKRFLSINGNANDPLKERQRYEEELIKLVFDTYEV
ncbi:MAG: 6-phosphogluconolactonase [Candidatus Omnitrophica bacterium]|nr:6-phosphogluconolactonase [Candidatus Omnitrophota bacterium]